MPLDESVRVYPFLTNPDVAHIEALTGFSVPVDQDIPSVPLPPGVLRVNTEFGVSAMWADSIIKADPSGTDDSPHLYFDRVGAAADVRSFWEGIWADADAKGIKLSNVIGSVGTTISPAQFMLKNLVGANTLFIVVDASQIDDISMMRNAMFFDMLRNVVPSAIRIFVVEHHSVQDPKDEINLGDMAEEVLPSVQMLVKSEVAPREECVIMRLVRSRPKLVRG